MNTRAKFSVVSWSYRGRDLRLHLPELGAHRVAARHEHAVGLRQGGALDVPALPAREADQREVVASPQGVQEQVQGAEQAIPGMSPTPTELSTEVLTNCRLVTFI